MPVRAPLVPKPAIDFSQPAAPAAPAPVPEPPQDEVIIEILTDEGTSTVTLRPAVISRLRSRQGKGPGFNRWLGQRIADHLNNFVS